MPFHKAMLNGELVDAFETLDCCKYVSRSRMVLRCSPKDNPEGVISARRGQFYHVEGWPDFPPEVEGSGGTIQLIEVEQEIYDALTDALDTGNPYEEPAEPEEPEYPADATLEYVKTAKKAALSKACNETIVAGFSIALSNGEVYDFDLTLEDQSNLLGLIVQIQVGAAECDYYTAAGECLTLTAADMMLLSGYATAFKSYHIAYYHCLCAWVDGLQSIPEVAAVSYGAVVPEEYRNAYLTKYAAAIGVIDYVAAAE